MEMRSPTVLVYPLHDKIEQDFENQDFAWVGDLTVSKIAFVSMALTTPLLVWRS